MRIGVVTPGFSASQEDWCIPAHLDLVRALAERSEVAVFPLRYPHRRDTYRLYGATVHPTGGAQRRGLARLPILLRGIARIVKQARRKPFDVLLALWAHEPGFVAAVAGRLNRTPVVVSILGGELIDLPDIGYGGGGSPVNRWLVRRSLRGADRIAVPSKLIWRLTAGHAPAEKLVIRTLGVDTRRFSPGPPAADGPRLRGSPRLLQVGSLVPVKDHATLLEAFAKIAPRFPGAHLHCAGAGELRPRLEGRARQLDVAARVEWHGAVDHARLADLYRQADLLVVSSRFETYPMAALEALACGCPVAGTEVGLIPELSRFPPAPPADPEALAKLLSAALDAPRGAADRSTAIENFELGTAAERWLRLFRALREPEGQKRWRKTND